jgi:hypothetical protein
MIGTGRQKNDAPGSVAAACETNGGLASGRVRAGLLGAVLVAMVAAAPAPAAETKPAPPIATPPAAVPAVARMPGPPPVTPKYNDVMTAVLYGDRAAVSQLLELGRWVDKPDSNGLTPLMAAVLMRDPDMVQLLLDRGADPNLQAPGGDVALEMARRNGDGASESQLLRAGAKY